MTEGRGHFLGVRRVIPQIRGRCLLFEVFDLATELIKLDDREDVLHSRTQVLDLF